MTTTLLALLLSVGSTASCAETRTSAAEAYTLARRQMKHTGEAVRRLRSARDCTLVETDTAQAAILHMQEIYLLSLSGGAKPYWQSIEDFFSTFHPHQAPVQYTWVMRKQAALEASRGNAARAFAILHRCLTMTLPTRPAERAETHLRIAELHRSLNQYSEAAEQVRQARTLIDRHLTGSTRERQRARLLINLAETMLQWHALEDVGPEVLAEARAAAEEAYALRAQASATDRLHVLHLLGDVLTHSGDLDAAARLLQQAVDESRSAEHLHYVSALYRLGRNRLRAGDLVQARRVLEMAFEESLGQGFLTWARRVRHDQARLEMRAGDVARARQYYREAIELVEALRAEIGTTEWAASSVSDWQAPYRGLARALLAQDSLAAALQVLEQSRARHLSALQARFNRLSTLDESASARADSLIAELTSVRNRMYGADGPRADSLRSKAAEMQLALDDIVGAPPSKEPVDLGALQAALTQNDRTILYYVLDREDRLFDDEFATYVLVLRPDTLALVRLQIQPDRIPHRLAAISPAMRGDQRLSGPATAFSLDVLHELYRELFAPVSPLIPAGAPVTIVPDGVLFALPFAALVTEPVGRFTYGQAAYLLDRHPLSIDLSLVPPVPRPPAAAPPLDLLAVGKSAFALPSLALAPLPGAMREVKAVTRPFGHTQTLRDADATRPHFAEAAPQSQVIHFATHALLDRTSPLYHALVLTPTGDSDGLLYLHEIEQMRVQAELVTLSGCNTARGDLRAGEGMAGLQYAFRAVGARSTVSTLWNLSDEAGAELFEAFYTHLADGAPKDVALQRAQQAYRQQHPDASPFFWASPVLYGSTTPLTLSKAGPGGWWMALLLVGAGLTFFLTWRKRRSSIRPTHATDSPL